MRIVNLPEDFSAKDMILDLADSLKIGSVEFAIYAPEFDGYGNHPRASRIYTIGEFRNLGIDLIKSELARVAGDDIVDEAVKSELGKGVADVDFWALGLSSRVTAGGAEFHLPQMDFGIGESEENLERVYRYLEEVGQNDGYMIMSGKSYHFQGRDLMPREFWKRFIDGLDDNVIDGKWAYESACTRGFSLLRLTSAYGKPVTPRIISRIYPHPKLPFEG